jgi:hypothetical protein
MTSRLESLARSHLKGLAFANEFEIQELRNASVDLKLRQLWALMSSQDPIDDLAQREADLLSVRERWDRFYLTQNG